MEVTNIKSPEEDLKNPNFEDLSDEFFDTESSVPWFVATRAVETFRVKYGRYPGLSSEQVETDFPALRSEFDLIMSQINDSVKVDDRYVKEMLRFSDSQLHSVSAFLGGVAS